MHSCIEASNDTRDDVPRRAPSLQALATPGSGAKVYLHTLQPTRCLPRPVRRDDDQYLYVLHGELDVWVAARHARLRAGMSVVLPRNVVHRSGNFGRGPAKLLIVATRGGCVPVVRRVDRLGAPCAEGGERIAAVVTPAGVDVVFG